MFWDLLFTRREVAGLLQRAQKDSLREVLVQIDKLDKDAKDPLITEAVRIIGRKITVIDGFTDP